MVDFPHFILFIEEDLVAGGCHYALLQQIANSNYIKAQNKRGGSALVTTTSIYSTDG